MLHYSYILVILSIEEEMMPRKKEITIFSSNRPGREAMMAAIRYVLYGMSVGEDNQKTEAPACRDDTARRSTDEPAKTTQGE
jgi:hypothetical protein